jgi:alkylhydroperoxidase family enzyme
MAYIRIVPEDEAEGPLARLYAGSRGREGTVAHIVRLMGLEPDVAEAALGFYLRLMKSRNGLSPARRELLAAVVSHVNDCFY